MEGSYKSLQKQVDKLTQENLQLKEELQKNNDKIDHIWNILENAGFLTKDGKIKESISRMIMTKKQRKRTQLQKAAESFTNKAEKWSNTDC